MYVLAGIAFVIAMGFFYINRASARNFCLGGKLTGGGRVEQSYTVRFYKLQSREGARSSYNVKNLKTLKTLIITLAFFQGGV